MRELTPFEMSLAAEAAARHRTPKATVTHPKGVIVRGDQILTDNIRNDPDYVPYCGPCVPMQRMRRIEGGFMCPTCLNKTNWDLTKFNGNVDVQFDPAYVDPVWLEKWNEEVKAIKAHEALHGEVHADFVLRQMDRSRFDWKEDQGKKNTSTHNCNNCGTAFFGKNKRKFCVSCQEGVTQRLENRINEQEVSYPWATAPRQILRR